MAIAVVQKSWGYAVTCSSGTAVPAIAIPKDTAIRIIAIVCGGAATTDITTVTDASGTQLMKGSAIINTVFTLAPGFPITVDGLQVGFAGATTGYCNIFVA
jgi:hypothetical protein